jgi:pimeloyl-ACP methyl ester carboxylesterase
VLIDQRGTGRSAPLYCDEDDPARPLRDSADPARRFEIITACREALVRLPHVRTAGGLQHYTTSIAMADADAVRQALGVEKVNLVGVSYGTRAALEYMRQFPGAVRRVVLDGIAPPDMALPAAASGDAQAAFDAVLEACENDSACSSRLPRLRAEWRELLAAMPQQVSVSHPVTGVQEVFMLTREMLLSLVRGPLYQPAFGAALPYAVSEAAQGRYTALVGLGSSALGGRRGMRLAQGMHFSVICAEDFPRMEVRPGLPVQATGADFGEELAELYVKVCTDWPKGPVPSEFYRVGPAPVATLLLSGGADPATPPRHGARMAAALGAMARHVVVPQASHGVMAVACMPDAVFRFIDAGSDDDALAVDADCAEAMPRPPAFVPVATLAPSATVAARPMDAAGAR